MYAKYVARASRTSETDSRCASLLLAAEGDIVRQGKPLRMKPFILLSAVALVVTGCGRTHISVSSPDGRVVARVLFHLSIDPPNQSLWLEPIGGTARQLRHLAEDQDWCNEVHWSADSSTVAFLIQDARLLAFTRSGQLLVDRWLVDDRGYPSREVARHFALSSDRSSASFQPCLRNPRFSTGVPGCSAVTTVRVRGPASRSCCGLGVSR
jgi:hypothetical protein